MLNLSIFCVLAIIHMHDTCQYFQTREKRLPIIITLRCLILRYILINLAQQTMGKICAYLEDVKSVPTYVFSQFMRINAFKILIF